MYILSLILLILLCIGWFVITTNADIVRYLDPASLIMLLLVTLPVLLSAGLLRDFNNAFRLSIRRTVVCSKAELLRAIEAVTLAAKALWTAGILDTLLGLIFAFTAEEFIRAYVGIALISLLYAAFLSIMLLPVRSRLLVRLHALPDPVDAIPKELSSNDHQAEL